MAPFESFRRWWRRVGTSWRGKGNSGERVARARSSKRRRARRKTRAARSQIIPLTRALTLTASSSTSTFRKLCSLFFPTSDDQQARIDYVQKCQGQLQIAPPVHQPSAKSKASSSEASSSATRNPIFNTEQFGQHILKNPQTAQSYV